jgi:hypothetical protein
MGEFLLFNCCHVDKKRELLDKILNPRPSVQTWEAEVQSVQETTCTVLLVASLLEVEDVRLVASVLGGEGFVLVPKVGSIVLVGCVQNEIGDLYVAQTTEIETLSFQQGKLSIDADGKDLKLVNDKSAVTISADKVTVDQNGTFLTLDGGKVSLKNSTTSLKDLFSDLVTLLNSFSVLTAQGPSAGLNPATITAVAQLNVKINSLLK